MISIGIHNYLLLLPLIFLAGFIDSIAGGGGLISVPAYLATGLPPHVALANNKFSSTFGTMLSTYRYSRKKMVNWWIAIPGAIFALIGSTLGSKTVLLLNPGFLNYLLLVLIPLITIFTLLNKTTEKDNQKRQFEKKVLIGIASIVSLVIGFYDGFFGPGTGSFLMFCFVVFLGCDYSGANANAKIVNLASNVAATTIFLFSGKMIFTIAIPAAICGILGNWLGSKLVIKNGVRIIRPFFLLVLGLLFIKIVYNLLT